MSIRKDLYGPTITLRDKMAELMPSLRWTRPMTGCAVGCIGKHYVARVSRSRCSHLIGIGMPGWYGHCQSPAHAADTIRRKLLEFRAVIDAALEETD